uniref:Secreted protein n=1 Tax=Brugia timori TaxID=42155 RepID=A0A0R3QD91_9BILA
LLFSFLSNSLTLSSASTSSFFTNSVTALSLSLFSLFPSPLLSFLSLFVPPPSMRSCAPVSRIALRM